MPIEQSASTLRVTVDDDGVVVGVNRAFCAALGSDSTRLVGVDLDRLTADPQARSFADDIVAVTHGDSVVGPSDRWFVTGDGGSFVGRFWMLPDVDGRHEIVGIDHAELAPESRRVALEAIIFRWIAEGMAPAEVSARVAEFLEWLAPEGSGEGGSSDDTTQAAVGDELGDRSDAVTAEVDAHALAARRVARDMLDLVRRRSETRAIDDHDLADFMDRAPSGDGPAMAAPDAELTGALRRGIQDRELEIHYQPILAVANGGVGGVIGAEALVRWRRSPHDLVPPAAFVPVAEASGLIDELGHDVLSQAIGVAAELRAGPWPQFVMSVNVSGRQFHDELVDQVAGLLEDHRLDPSGLDLEITENMLIRRGADAVVHRLHELGVGITIDDFGTGYSSLSYLRRYRIASGLKIDASFVRDLGDETSRSDAVTAAAIVTAAIALGHSLGMIVTAEGIEHRRQLDALAALGCDRAQGYLMSRPVAASDLAAALVDVATEDETG